MRKVRWFHWKTRQNHYIITLRSPNIYIADRLRKKGSIRLDWSRPLLFAGEYREGHYRGIWESCYHSPCVVLWFFGWLAKQKSSRFTLGKMHGPVRSWPLQFPECAVRLDLRIFGPTTHFFCMILLTCPRLLCFCFWRCFLQFAA